jgi:hypothetical protein
MVISENFVDPNWTNTQKSLYSYDGNGNITNVIFQDWISASGLWKNSTQFIYTYNTNQTINNSQIKQWDSVGSIWNNWHRDTFTNNSAGKRILVLSERWNALNNNWENTGRGIYTYDTNGYLTNTLNQNWSSSWNNSVQTIYNNNIDGTINYTIQQIWDNNTWKNTTKTFYTYTPSGKLAGYNYQNYSIDSVWITYGRVLFTYDMSDFLINYIYENYISTSWQPASQVNFTNYSNGIKDYDISQQWTDSGWVNNYKNTYYYDSLGTPNYNYQSTAIIYPNPSSEQISIKTNLKTNENTNYTIVDLNGKFILNGNLRMPETIVDISGLNTGVYFIQIDNQQTFKFIKK